MLAERLAAGSFRLPRLEAGKRQVMIERRLVPARRIEKDSFQGDSNYIIHPRIERDDSCPTCS